MASVLFRRVMAGTAVGGAVAAVALGGCLGSSSPSEGLGTTEQAVYAPDATADADATHDAPSEVHEAGETNESLATESASESTVADTLQSEAESGTPACAGDPSVSIGDAGDGGATCTGNLAQQTFQRAICTCGSLTASGALTTDGFNSGGRR